MKQSKKKSVPLLHIDHLGGAALGRCYTGMSYKVISNRELDDDKLWQLRELGFLGYGQEFYIQERKQVPEAEFYDPKQYEVSKHGKVYIYTCESRVDSSD